MIFLPVGTADDAPQKANLPWWILRTLFSGASFGSLQLDKNKPAAIKNSKCFMQFFI
jgi:hypothetical protein